MKTLNKLRDEIHEYAINKGFWDNQRETGTLLMLCVSELAEAMEADRNGLYADLELIEKDKEDFNQFLNENQDKLIEWRLINAFRQMVLEVEQIAKMRNAKSEIALISIFKEIETKSHSFIRLVNETEPFKTEGTVKYDAFKLFVEQSSPDLAAVVWRS